MESWVKKLFESIDKKDAAGFASFLTEDASFRFGSAQAVSGRANIDKAVTDFFLTMQSLRHNILNVWDEADTLICEGEATYVMPDGRQITLPFVNIFKMKDGLIADYRIYIDTQSFSA